MSRRCSGGLGEAADAERALEEALAGALPLPPGANLAFLYCSDHFAPDYKGLVDRLRALTGIGTVVGTVGLGVVDRSGERFDRPAVSVMALTLPDDAFCAFGPVEEMAESGLGAWIEGRAGSLALISADPRTPDLPSLLADLSEQCRAYCIGGLTASRRGTVASGARVTAGPGIGGLLVDTSAVTVAVGHTQSCLPLTEPMAVTSADGQVVKEIEGQPALNALLDLVERDFGGNLAEAWPLLHPAFPVLGSDRGDYLVRDFVGLDPDQGWLAVGELVEPGRRILFCRRDAEAARTDLARMAAATRARVGTPPQGGVYISCVARGPQLFGGGGAEVEILRQALGDIPITGFYAAGEIAGERLYGYTGVLALFA